MSSVATLRHRFLTKQAAPAAPDAPPFDASAPPTDGGEGLVDVLSQLLAHLRAMHLWMHGAHHVSKGPTFAGDHVLILNRIYDEIQEQVDLLAEKGIGLTGDDTLGSPQRIMAAAMPVLSGFPEVSSLQQEALMRAAFEIEQTFIAVLERQFHSLEQSGQLSLGLNNFLAGIADTHEGYLYFLRQRTAQ